MLMAHVFSLTMQSFGSREGKPTVTFSWRPVPEHLANLLGIGELLPMGDPLRSQMGQLPQPLG